MSDSLVDARVLPAESENLSIICRKFGRIVSLILTGIKEKFNLRYFENIYTSVSFTVHNLGIGS